MITNRQKNLIIFFSTKALFLGVGYSLILEYSQNDAWICFILGSLLGLIFCFMLKKVLDYKKNKSLIDLLNEMSFIGIIIRILFIILSIVIINELLFILQIFAKSFFLINSNTFLIILPMIILASYVAFKGYKLFSYVVECLFPIAVFFILFAFLALIFKVDYTNLKPILSHTNIDMIKGIFYYFSLSTTPLLFLLDMNFEDNNITNTYIISSIILTIISILLVGVLGRFLITIYRFPEYMILKEIELFNFIEKVENIISITWIIDNFILTCFACAFLKRMLPKKYNNYLFIIIISIIFLVVCTIFGNSYINDLYIYLYLPYILTIISLPIKLTLFIYVLKKRK
jgi:spore germination protein (amino acid permease)